MMAGGFAETPKPPYYAVIFTSKRTDGDHGYDEMARAMLELAAQQPGYLGFESAGSPNGLGISVSYFADEASILAWKRNVSHAAAQRLGKKQWYTHYEVRVAKVERAYGGPDTAA